MAVIKNTGEARGLIVQEQVPWNIVPCTQYDRWSDPKSQCAPQCTVVAEGMYVLRYAHFLLGVYAAVGFQQLCLHVLTIFMLWGKHHHSVIPLMMIFYITFLSFKLQDFLLWFLTFCHIFFASLHWPFFIQTVSPLFKQFLSIFS